MNYSIHVYDIYVQGFLTSEHLEGASFASSVYPQQPKGFLGGYSQTEVIHSSESVLTRVVYLGQVLYPHCEVGQCGVQYLLPEERKV